MHPQPLVSIIMPVYNGEKYLKEAIDSVLAQTYSHFELLLINDGSSDSSKEIILSYSDPRIRYIENERNIKLIATLNKGIRLAGGEYIARMDADDVCLPKRLEKQVQYLNRHPNIDMCGTWAIRIDAQGNITGKIKNIDNPGLLKCATYFTCPFIHPTTMFRAQVLRDNPYSMDVPDVEDTELWHRLSQKGHKLANIPEYHLKYRWHGNNISAKKEDYVIATKKRIFSPSLESFLDRPISEEELNLHLLSFLLYHFGERQAQHHMELLHKEKDYLELLFQQNGSKQWFNKFDWASFLFSRWVVCCFSNKKLFKILSIQLPWYQPKVIFRTIKLLLYK